MRGSDSGWLEGGQRYPVRAAGILRLWPGVGAEVAVSGILTPSPTPTHA